MLRPGTDYKLDSSLAILLLGKSGTGKTNLAMEFDTPLFIDFGDSNLSNAVVRHPGKPFFWSRIDEDEAGNLIAPDKRWDRSEKLLDEGIANPAVKTLVDDTLSMMQVVLKDHLKAEATRTGEKLPRIANELSMSKTLWEPFAAKISKRIIRARTSRKPYVMICHVEIDENELTTVKEQRPAVQGQLGNHNKLESFFSDVWMTEATPHSDLKRYPTGIRYLVRTLPTTRVTLKNSLGLPAELDFNWNEVEKRLVGGAK